MIKQLVKGKQVSVSVNLRKMIQKLSKRLLLLIKKKHSRNKNNKKINKKKRNLKN